MSIIAKLKQKASDLEQKKQDERALEIYEQVLEMTKASEDREIALHNRVGDLHYRLGHHEQAIQYFEKAADLYAESGFINNAIALCNKILRYSPGRSNAYYKLGLLNARKGFNNDAKQNFLEYADRMQKGGKLDEAFRALKEFADLCPGQDDVRLMLAEQLVRADRKPEALEQLQILYENMDSDGRTAEAAATLERITALDPTFTPKRKEIRRKRKKDGLVFLDLDFDEPATPDVDRVSAAVAPPATAAASHPSPEPATPARAIEASTLPDLEPTSLAEAPALPTTQSAEDDARSAESRIGDVTLIYPEEEQEREVANGRESVEDAESSGAGGPGSLDLAPLLDEAVQHAPAVETPALHDPLAGLDIIDTTQPPASDFVDLGAWLQENKTPTSTRMVAHDEEPEEGEQKDFAEMLEKFKEGVARNVDNEDFASHYDLGVAFREMGLVDEAIAAFQKASHGEGQRLRAAEALGECFLSRDEPRIGMSVLEKAMRESGGDDHNLIGVLYLIGRSAEALGDLEKASTFYQRVVAVDINFRDAQERLTSLTRVAR